MFASPCLIKLQLRRTVKPPLFVLLTFQQLKTYPIKVVPNQEAIRHHSALLLIIVEMGH